MGPMPIPIPVVYAGLAGCLLALVVASISNGWSLRVFFLLALRLAIGWHFLFEGLHKVNSHMVGVTETNRPFSSEPYFRVAEGPFGEFMRNKYLGNPSEFIATHLTPTKKLTAEEFGNLSTRDQALHCPARVSETLANSISDQEKLLSAQAEFARWVYGVDRREGSVKFVASGDVPQSAADRLVHIDLMKRQVRELESRRASGLGQGFGIEQSLWASANRDLRSAETSLINDTEEFVKELITKNGGNTEQGPQGKAIDAVDQMTMWMLVIVGCCLLFGLFTPVACIVAAGFLFLTYLTHPPFPWYPLPPNTEGNPVFINKNVIEALALLVIAVHPTGRWLGIDALWTRLFSRT
jgi:uncharacterized membrane protein YphA (DoxX/SURF4 family)